MVHQVIRPAAYKRKFLEPKAMNKYYFNNSPKSSKIEKKEPKMRSKNSKPNLIKKLDRIFSLYIRLRDVMPSGYVRCISCGQIKRFEEVDCGHFHSRRHMATRYKSRIYY